MSRGERCPACGEPTSSSDERCSACGFDVGLQERRRTLGEAARGGGRPVVQTSGSSSTHASVAAIGVAVGLALIGVSFLLPSGVAPIRVLGVGAVLAASTLLGRASRRTDAWGNTTATPAWKYRLWALIGFALIAALLVWLV